MKDYLNTLYFWGTEEECLQLIDLSKREDKSISVLYTLIFSELDEDDIEEIDKDPSYVLDYQSKWDYKGLSTTLEPIQDIPDIFVLKITTDLENLIEANHLKEWVFMDQVSDRLEKETVYYLPNTTDYQAQWLSEV